MPTAATVNISETNGDSGSPVVTDGITNLNFGSVDAPNIVAANHPVAIGTHSYGKYERFHVASLGDSTTISDLRYWASVYVPLTGERLRTNNYGNNGGSVITYATPSQTSIGTTTIATSDPGSANVDIGGSLVGTIIAPGYSGYFQFQTQTNVGGATPSGPANTKTLIFQYTEV